MWGDRHSSPQEGRESPLSPSPSLGLDPKILCFSWDLDSSPSGLITRAKPGVSLRLPTPLPASGPLLQGTETGHPHWKHPGSLQLRGLRRGRFGPDRHLCSLLILPSKVFRVASPSVNFETLRKSPQERTATTRTAHIRWPPRWPGTLSPPYGVLALSPRSLSVPGFPRPLQRPLQDSPLVKSSPNSSSREAAARSSPEALQDQIALHEAILFCSRYPLPSPFPHPSGSFFGCRPLHHVAVSFRNLVLPPGTPWYFPSLAKRRMRTRERH